MKQKLFLSFGLAILAAGFTACNLNNPANSTTEDFSENTEAFNESTEVFSESTEIFSESTEIFSESTEIFSESTEILSESTEATENEFESTSEVISEESPEEISDEHVKEEEAKDYTFEDLSTRVMYFASGIGGWNTEVLIEKDGYFTGAYHDMNMGYGDTGEGYEIGTMYWSSFSGHFTNWTKINKYCYEMTLADITYENKIGTEENRDDIHYIYSDAYGLTGSNTFRVYFPGMPIDDIPTEVYERWLYQANYDKLPELPEICMVNVENQEGFTSYERSAPLDDARFTYERCKERYDNYSKMIAESTVQQEMAHYAECQFEEADDCLNSIWHLVKYNTDETEFEKILQEQRQWIADKEQRASELPQEGSASATDCNEVLAEMTMERCQDLIEYLE